MKVNSILRRTIPFEFVLDCLGPLAFTVKPMFGMWAIYVDQKIVLILKQKNDNPDTNGVWIATYKEHHKSLKNEFPSLHSISSSSIGIDETEWQVLPIDTEDFETSVRKVCELIKHNDSRVGRIPKPRQTRSKAKNINKSGKFFPDTLEY